MSRKQAKYGAIRYTEPFLNNQHITEPTLFYLRNLARTDEPRKPTCWRDAEGNVLLFVGTLGSHPGRLYLPGGRTIDENDRIYIAHQLNARVSVFQYLKAN